MKISLIVAHGHDNVIGRENTLPWRLPADMQWFRRHTLGKEIIMGRKTFDSLGKPLPERRNIVISRNPQTIEGVEFVRSIEEAFKICNGSEVMVIGGAEIYKQVLDQAHRLYVTEVDVDVSGGDAFFPEFDHKDWQEVSRETHQANEKNPHDHSFVVFDRR